MGADSTSRISKRILLIIGMSTAWLPVTDRLLYPVSFTYINTGDATVYLYNIIYSILAVSIAFVVGIISYRLQRAPFANKYVLLATGVGASVGIALTAFLNFSSWLSSLFIGVGVFLVALYVPVHFVFWSHCFSRTFDETVLADAALSFVLASFVFALFATFGVSTVCVEVFAPLLSALLGFFYIRSCSSNGENAKEAEQVLGVPHKTSIFVASLVLVLLCNIAIAYFNNNARLQAEVPYRPLIFWGQLAVFLVIAYLYLPGKRRKPATMCAFAVVSLAFVGMLFVAIFVSDSLLNVGTVPLNCANFILVAFVWLFIIRDANRKRKSLAFVMSLHLALVVLLPRFMQACVMYRANFLTLFAQSINYVYLVAVIAFLAVCVVVATLFATFMGERKEKSNGRGEVGELGATLAAPSSSMVDGLTSRSMAADGLSMDVPSANAAAAGAMDSSAIAPEYMEDVRRSAQCEEVLLSLKDTAKLSNREIGVARFALKNYSAKKMSQTLFVSENTIYSHLKHIYQKTGVHSKQEFIDFVEGQFSDL